MRYNGGLLGGALPALLLVRPRQRRVRRRAPRHQLRDAQSGPQLLRQILRPVRRRPSRRASGFLEFETLVGRLPLHERGRRSTGSSSSCSSAIACRDEAHLEPGRPLDLKAIRSPIIVFASWGDNITPPQQALNWIVDTYADEHEITIRGQRIIYMVHDKVGHLGIFVSSSIAKKEHAEVASTMKTIEALRARPLRDDDRRADRRRRRRALHRQLPRAQDLRHSRHRRERPQRRARFRRRRAASRSSAPKSTTLTRGRSCSRWSTPQVAAALRAASRPRLRARCSATRIR